MIKLKSLVFPSDAASSYASELYSDPSLIEPDGLAGRIAAVHELPMVDPQVFIQGIPSREVSQLRKKESMARQHWAGHFRTADGETVEKDGIRFLTQDIRDHNAGCLVYFRQSNRGQLVVFLDHLHFDPETLDVVLRLESLAHPAPTDFAAANTAATEISAMGLGDVPALKWASEVSTVISLVGMTAISSAPQIGIPVMIAGQVFSFVFGHMDDGSQKKPLPTIEAIRATFKDLLAQAHIEDLSEEAYSVWDDYLTYYDKSWETGFVANEETLELCKCVLQRAIALDKPGNLHDNVNKIYDNCLRRESGRAVGLQWIPAFVYAGTIELTCLEASHNLEMYVSNAGRSDDEKKNKRYRLALEAWNTRAHDISDKLVGVLRSARAVLDRRLSEVDSAVSIADVTSDPSVPDNRTKTSITENHHWEFDDTGTWPAGASNHPAGKTYFSYTTNCCGTTSHGDVNGDEIKQKRAQYLTRLQKKVRPAIGISEEGTVTAALERWQAAAEIAVSNRRMLESETT